MRNALWSTALARNFISAKSASPDRLDRIASDHWIRCQNGQVVKQRLTNEHSIKRVGMDARKFLFIQSSRFIEQQRGNSARLPPARNKTIGLKWQRETAIRILYSNLPC